MKYHKDLTLQKWQKLSLAEQMANIGSEVERTIIWRGKNKELSDLAFERALELIHLTIESNTQFSKLKELTRTREALLDYFWGKNEYKSSDEIWRKYFYAYAYFCRRNT